MKENKLESVRLTKEKLTLALHCFKRALRASFFLIEDDNITEWRFDNDNGSVGIFLGVDKEWKEFKPLILGIPVHAENSKKRSDENNNNSRPTKKPRNTRN